jgi:pyocin large subunit-like protein
MAKANKVKIAEDEEWRVDSDLRTLMDAEKIRRDPKRLAKAKALAKARMLEAAAVASAESADD